MLNIVKSDLFRIFKGKAIYIVILVIIIMTIVNVISMSAGSVGLSLGSSMNQNDMELMGKLNSAKSIGEFRKIMKEGASFALDKNILAQSMNLYYFFIVIVVIIVSTDFSNKSVKNTLSSAISRKRYYLSKLILITILCTAIIVFHNCFSYFLNMIVNGSNFASNFGEIIKITVMQLPLLYGIMSLLVSLAFILKKTSLFNSISIPFIMVVQLIAMGIINLFRLEADWFNYEIQVALQKIVTSSNTIYIRNCILLGIAYIIVFNLIGYFSFKKAEIK